MQNNLQVVPGIFVCSLLNYSAISVAQTLYRRMIGGSKFNELETKWKWSWPNLRYLGGGITNTLSQDNLTPSSDLYPKFLKYEA